MTPELIVAVSVQLFTAAATLGVMWARVRGLEQRQDEHSRAVSMAIDKLAAGLEKRLDGLSPLPVQFAALEQRLRAIEERCQDICRRRRKDDE